MTVVLRAGAALVIGLIAGAVVMLGLQQARSAPDVPDVPAGGDPQPEAPVDLMEVTPAPGPPPPVRVLLVCSPGGHPEGCAAAAAALPRVEAATVVRGDLLEMTASFDADGQPADALPAGFVLPLDAIAVDPGSYMPFVPKSAAAEIAALGPGEALLGTTSADLRGVGAGGVLELAGGERLVVAGVLADELIGAAEVVVRADALPDVVTERYLLIAYQGERAAVEEAVRRAAPPDAPLRLRGPGETPYFRHGDAVLPQAIVKEIFGEFSYRRGASREFAQDPDWVAEHIVTRDVPLLGSVTCHRGIMSALSGALGELEQRNLGWLVEPEGYAGCYNPRLTTPLDSVSRHAWGIAVDVNQHKNPFGQAGAQDPRLIEVFERWGFGWGGEWLIPDPAHFEYLHGGVPTAVR
jgi:hypothetical protein